jgi:agmatinase
LQQFLNTQTAFEDARYVLFGAPLDLTSSYRSGSRFGPGAIRQESLYMETFSLRTGLDWSHVKVADIGDVKDLGEVEKALRSIEFVSKQIHESGKVNVMLGGEHTVTLGALRALKPDYVVDLDAHFDLRESLLGLELSHATFMRRGLEEIGCKLMILGCRALSRGERSFASINDQFIKVVTADELNRGGLERWGEELKRALCEASRIYLTIDMDVVDPAMAPAVSNPAPEGISVTTLLDLVNILVDSRFVGFDLTEVTPRYDSGLTATQAAYVILETIYSLESSRSSPEV